MANTDVDVLGYSLARSLDPAVEGRGSVEVCWQQAASVVHLYLYLQHAGHPGDNLHLWIQQEEIITHTKM